MARRYSITGTDTNTAATTMLGLTSTAAIRPIVYEIIIGLNSAPADSYAEYAVQRYTAAGTSTAVTPQALDSGDPAATATAGMAHSVEPTYTANAILLQCPVYSRSTFRWTTFPEFGLKLPATAANGVGLLVTAVGTAQAIRAVFHFEE